MGREKAVRNGATQHIRIHVRVILDMEDVCEKMTKDSAQGIRQAEFQCSRTQSVVINSLWIRWMCVTLQRAQSLIAWWQVVARFYFSLRCESQLNCLTDTDMELIFLGSQPSLSTKWLNCVHGLCRDGICTDTSELEADLHLLKSIPKGLQVHRCTQLFECFWDSISIYIYCEYKHMLPKLCMNKCKIHRRLAENFQVLDGRKTTLPSPTPGTALQQWLHCQTSSYTVLMENSTSLLCSFQC